jgi:hypothetical protein
MTISITPEEYSAWRAKQIEIGRRKLISVLESIGVPLPAPMPWERRWSGLSEWED